LFLDKYIKMMKKEGVILNYSGGNLEEIDVPKIELDKYIEANDTFIVAMVQEVLNAYEENRTFSIEKTQELWIQMTGYNRYKKVSTKESNQKFLEIFKDKPQQQENNQD
jgi:dissimilatory sulfite reductase (desulfoviridin) alpha/beta subunit